MEQRHTRLAYQLPRQGYAALWVYIRQSHRDARIYGVERQSLHGCITDLPSAVRS